MRILIDRTTNITLRYTANVVSALLLFDSLGSDWADPDEPLVMADGTSLTRSAAHSRARDIAITWQQNSPEKTQVDTFSFFFRDNILLLNTSGLETFQA